MKRLLILASGLILGACATVVSYQNNCEKTTSNFEGLVACTKEAILKDPRPGMQADSRVKLYLLKADQLVDRVKTGRLSEVDARVDLQQLLVTLKSQEAAERPVTVDSPTTTRTNCTTYGNSTNCVSR